jgi:hypothetical protein
MSPACSLATPFDAQSSASIVCDHTAPVAQLGEAIAQLAVRLHAATYELLVMLREFDQRAGWNTGFLSCAHWLHWRTGIDLGAAREKVRVARALAELPQISAAMRRGELSYAKMRALTRIATPDNELRLLDVARAGTAAHIERLVRAWRRVDRNEAARVTEGRHQHRHLTTWVDDDGMLVIRGRLTPEVGAVVQRALDAAADHLFQESAQAADAGQATGETTAGQRRADALGRVAECALAADLDRGTAGDRYQVIVHVEPVALEAGAAPRATDAGQAVIELGDGATCVSAETSQRIACDASLIVMHHNPDGSVLDVGRKTRTIPAAIRRALTARDRCCQFPGCTARRCDGHHIRHWARGGATRLDNLVLLCRRHHRAVHEYGFGIVRGRDGSIGFFRPDGTPLAVAPLPPRWTDNYAAPVAPTATHIGAAGATVDGHTATPRWDGTPFDVVWAIDVLRGREADHHVARRSEQHEISTETST